MRFYSFVLMCLMAVQATASPCSGIEAPVPTREWPRWAPAIAKQLGTTRVTPLRYFAVGPWRFISVKAEQSDVVVAFVAGDPSHPYIVGALWNTAKPSEEGTRKWLLEHAAGMPPPLANCFVFHVTKELRRSPR